MIVLFDYRNNSFLVWLAHVMNLVRLAMERSATGNICELISHDKIHNANHPQNSTAPRVCVGNIEDNVVLALVISQTIFAILNFALSYLSHRRKAVLTSILCLSALSGSLLNLTPEAISSVFFFMIFTCTCLCMGILASFFVDLYPPSYRGMVACLSIMVGRGSSFVGINIVGNLLFNHCQLMFYMWSLLVLTQSQRPTGSMDRLLLQEDVLYWKRELLNSKDRTLQMVVSKCKVAPVLRHVHDGTSDGHPIVATRHAMMAVLTHCKSDKKSQSVIEKKYYNQMRITSGY
ncbi:hypothetical protein evm_014993 [Chilo suppressalis]|nr:hypothetical protein evm_014993 [Chilo suppressalis]